MLRLISRAAAAAAALSKQRNDAVLTSTSILNHQFLYSTKTQTKSSKKKQDDNKKASKSKSKSSDANSLSTAAAAAQADSADDLESVRARARRLAEDDRNPSLDVGPNHRPLFTKTTSLSLLTRKDACTYFKFRY